MITFDHRKDSRSLSLSRSVEYLKFKEAEDGKYREKCPICSGMIDIRKNLFASKDCFWDVSQGSCTCNKYLRTAQIRLSTEDDYGPGVIVMLIAKAHTPLF